MTENVSSLHYKKKVYFTGNIFCQANPVYIYIFSSSNKKKQLPGQMSMVHVTGVARLPGVFYFWFCSDYKNGEARKFSGQEGIQERYFFKKKIPRFVNNIIENVQ